MFCDWFRKFGSLGSLSSFKSLPADGFELLPNALCLCPMLHAPCPKLSFPPSSRFHLPSGAQAPMATAGRRPHSDFHFPVTSPFRIPNSNIPAFCHLSSVLCLLSSFFRHLPSVFCPLISVFCLLSPVCVFQLPHSDFRIPNSLSSVIYLLSSVLYTSQTSS